MNESNSRIFVEEQAYNSRVAQDPSYSARPDGYGGGQPLFSRAARDRQDIQSHRYDPKKDSCMVEEAGGQSRSNSNGKKHLEYNQSFMQRLPFFKKKSKLDPLEAQELLHGKRSKEDLSNSREYDSFGKFQVSFENSIDTEALSVKFLPNAIKPVPEFGFVDYEAQEDNFVQRHSAHYNSMPNHYQQNNIQILQHSADLSKKQSRLDDSLSASKTLLQDQFKRKQSFPQFKDAQLAEPKTPFHFFSQMHGEYFGVRGGGRDRQMRGVLNELIQEEDPILIDQESDLTRKRARAETRDDDTGFRQGYSQDPERSLRSRDVQPSLRTHQGLKRAQANAAENQRLLQWQNAEVQRNSRPTYNYREDSERLQNELGYQNPPQPDLAGDSGTHFQSNLDHLRPHLSLLASDLGQHPAPKFRTNTDPVHNQDSFRLSYRKLGEENPMITSNKNLAKEKVGKYFNTESSAPLPASDNLMDEEVLHEDDLGFHSQPRYYMMKVCDTCYESGK